ncbi:hypothetical protein PACILC2_22180 [Paenibacillus cisolokensis]|uniref:Tail fiber protein n=1 Tax=Paenibacillus cisolokensis TaxID=1658519 RepID=A0ABQ4N675_9BACL|nr:hypothetical protein [Paenibacillus cisolokensis]GIQ63650.1 hypothetical protein PACILC2_22180 [Paenibacillus cisolokensis]
MAKTDWNLNDSVMPEDMNQIGQEINDMAESLDNHKNATLAHGATEAATPNRIARRDANGQFEVGAPTAANHVARKTDLDEVKQSVSDGKNQIASAITGMGQTASGSDTFAQLSGKIRDISKDANAAVGDVLTGKTFYQGGVKRTGTMANRGNVTQTLTTQGQEYTIPAGYHGGAGKVTANITNLASVNIKAGVTVGGVAGTFTNDANAAAADILSGKTAYVNGSKVTGSMPSRTGHVTGQSVSRSGTSVRIRPQAGYYPGSTDNSVQISDANFIAANIKSGVSIFGLAGTLRAWNGEKKFARGSLNPTTNYFTVSGLAFTPSFVFVTVYDSNGPCYNMCAISTEPAAFFGRRNLRLSYDFSTGTGYQEASDPNMDISGNSFIAYTRRPGDSYAYWFAIE